MPFLLAAQERHHDRVRTSRIARKITIGAAVGVCTLVAYLAWLGWDQDMDLHADGSVTGPYEGWQVLGLVISLAAIAGWAGWRASPWVGTLVTTAATTTSWTVDAVTDAAEVNDGLWPIGAVTVAVGTFAGTLIVALLADQRAKAAQVSGQMNLPRASSKG